MRVSFVLMREIERQTLERYGHIDALELYILGCAQRSRRKIQNRFDPDGHYLVDDVLCRFRGNGNNGNRDLVARGELAQLPDIKNRHAQARFLTDFGRERIEQCRNLEPLLLKPRIVCERKTEVAGAEDRNLQPAVEAENLPKVLFQILDVVADAAYPEL